MEQLRQLNADILVLTETNSAITPGPEYHQVSTRALSEADPTYYRQGEIRTTIWSKLAAIHQTTTYDADTRVCIQLPTPLGELSVYATVIGVYGNRNPTFLPDLNNQISDWKRIAATDNVCIVGDFNLSFRDPYYYTRIGRQLVIDCFKDLRVRNLTADIPNNIDHIAISESFTKHAKWETGFWNEDKQLSDHMGVWADLEI